MRHRRWTCLGLGMLFAFGLLCVAFTQAGDYKTDKKAAAKTKVTLSTRPLPPESWLQFATTPLQPGEIDRLIGAELTKAGVQPAPRISDEQFVRRVYIDVIGRAPTRPDMRDFLSQTDPDRRAKLIDKLLDSDEYAGHWARYWHQVIASKLTDNKGVRFAGSLENWLKEHLQKNTSWGTITRQVLTATDSVRIDKPGVNGQAYFLISRQGPTATTELAAETSRVFLGIQIQCAQCHNHPTDVWKRKDFHEFAAFFVRLKARPIRDEKKVVGFTLVSTPRGEYRMPDRDDPKKSTLMTPRFLAGASPGPQKSDMQRRTFLADAITARDNPWFAGAFVNRLWGELMGQSFYMPIDDIGPQKEGVMPEVLARIAGSFRGSDYNVKQLFRDLLNSETYQRQIRPSETQPQFTGTNPTHLQADVLWRCLTATLGPIGKAGPALARPGGAGLARVGGGLQQVFKNEFGFDPSTKPEDVEGSVTQALLLMNNPQINQKIKAVGNNFLARVLANNARDENALTAVYLTALSRRPSPRELARLQTHIRAVGNRSEAYEDILWALINSTEFQTRR